MTQGVCAWPVYLYTRFAKVQRYGGGNSPFTDRLARSKHTEKHMTILRLRPARADILDQGFGHHTGERISCRMTRLTLRDLQPLAFPIDVIEGQLGDLMRA